MSSSEHPPSPTLVEIDARVNDIREFLKPPVEDLFCYLIHRDREPSAKMTVVGHVALEFLKWRDARDGNDTDFKTHGFKDRYTPASRPKGDDAEKRAVKVRTLADKLRDKLFAYYQRNFGIPPRTHAHLDPPQSEVSAGRAERIVYVEIPDGEGWKPFIQWRTRAIKKSTEPVERGIDFEKLGTNADGMQYLAKHIPYATRIEDTAIRWNITDSLFEENDLNDFKKALTESQAKYVSITGPVKDSAFMRALKEAFGKRAKDRQECFQLHHTAPIMNFIILKYPTDPTEVLFGFGIQHGDSTLEETAVFRSNNSTLVKEFQRLFKVLQSKKFSSRINVTAPTFLQTYQDDCNVLATFTEMPREFIRELIESEDCTTIRIGTTCSVEIEPFATMFGHALRRNVTVQILLSHPHCNFLKLRGETTSRNLDKLVRDNLEALRKISPHPGLEVKLTPDAMAVTHTQIDRIIIFSPFWNGRAAAHGHHFIVQATSETGEFLGKQFNKLWTDASPVILSPSEEIVIPPLPRP